jgi:hypothetical protein
MKKGFFAILTALTVLALALMGCPTDGGDGGGGGGGDTNVTITFDINNGPGTAPSPATIVKGRALSAKFPVAPAGGIQNGKIWTFTGWNLAATGTGTAVTAAAPTFSASTTVYARWDNSQNAPTAGKVAVVYNFNWPTGTTPTAHTVEVDKSTAIGTLYTPTAAQTPANGTLEGWYTTSATTGTAVTSATNVGDPNPAIFNLYAKWTISSGPGPGPGDELLLGSERVSLGNASQVVYQFVLPEGKTYGDYLKVTASYLIDDEAIFEGENSGRAIRLYGNYALDFFQFNETTAGNKYAYASLDGSTNNNEYILAGEGGGWMTLSDALIALLPSGECPEVNTWFDIDYTLDGSKANVKPHKHLPRDNFAGPFIFGLGLPNNAGAATDTPNTFYIKDVTLVGKSGTANVVATPLYIEKDGYSYPAFSAYGTADGNGVDLLKRELVDGSAPTPVAWAENPLKGSEKVSLGNASQVVYRFVLPSGKTYADYAKLTADYLIDDEAIFEGENSGRAIRLYGNYGLDFFQFNTTTAGNKYAYASLDGSTNNNEYILAGEGGGWMTLSDALIALLPSGECPEVNTWFSIDYTLDGSKANVKPHKHLPADTDTGPFIFGLGLPNNAGAAADTPNTFYIRNVRLVGNDGTADVVATPLIITQDGYDYPAFSAYGTADGNGVDLLKRELADGSRYVGAVAAVAPQQVTITFNLNGSSGNTPSFADGFAGTKTILKGAQIGTLPTATGSDGWLFGGWTTAADGTTAIATTTIYTDDGDLYAIWIEDVPAGLPIDLTFADGDLTATGNATVAIIDGGYKVTYGTVTNSNYGSPNAWFKLDFTALGITDLTEIKSVKFTFTPIAGDVASKDIYIAASATAHGWANDETYTAETISGVKGTGTDTTVEADLLLVQDKVASLTSDSFFVIRIHANNTGAVGGTGSTTEFSITNVQLIPVAD